MFHVCDPSSNMWATLAFWETGVAITVQLCLLPHVSHGQGASGQQNTVLVVLGHCI